MTRTYLLIATLPSSPSPTERTSSHPREIIDADCICRASASRVGHYGAIQMLYYYYYYYTNSYVLNSGVTEPNLTKFLQGVQKCLSITLLKSKLRSSNHLETPT